MSLHWPRRYNRPRFYQLPADQGWQANDKIARERLTEMEQIRFVLGGMLKSSTTQLDSVWPIDLVLFNNAREYGPNALPTPFVEGGSAILSAGSADNPQPQDWRRELVRRSVRCRSSRKSRA